ncbi:MAG: BatD family protein, partial [Planctomycetota bacterium]
AVGQYNLRVSTIQRYGKVGDPIKVTIYIEGDGPMDLVQPPNLTQQPQLTELFRVSTDRLAGVVTNDRKRFEATIRPKSSDVTQIPPIEYTFFDPDEERFVTLRSEPISIEVDEVQELALDSIVSANRPQPSTEETRDEANSSSLSSGEDNEPSSVDVPTDPVQAIQAGPSQAPARWVDFKLIVALSIAPLLFSIAMLMGMRRTLWAVASRLRSQLGPLRQQLAAASTGQAITHAMTDFLVRRFTDRLSDLDSDQILGWLRRHDQSSIANEADRLFSRCRQYDQNPVLRSTQSLDELKRDAMTLASRIVQRGRTSDRNTRSGNSAGSGTPVAITALALAIALAMIPTNGLGQEVTPEVSKSLSVHLQALLDETTRQHREANRMTGEARQQTLDKVIQNYELALAEGVETASLHHHLAIAWQDVGKSGHAIAHYRRALLREPDHANALRRLQELTGTLDRPASEFRFSQWMATLVPRLASWVPPKAFRWFALAAWSAFWLVLGWCCLSANASRINRLLTLVFSLAIAIMVATPYVNYRRRVTMVDRAVVVVSDLQLRAADGPVDPVIHQLKAIEGALVQVIDRRPGWVRIAVSQSQVGWAPVGAINEII